MNRSKRKRVAAGINLFRRFRDEDPEYIDTHKLPQHDVLMLIGTCDGVLYTTSRSGKVEKYIHKFSGNSRPLLACSWDGKQLYLVGGRYNFTDEGIVDSK